VTLPSPFQLSWWHLYVIVEVIVGSFVSVDAQWRELAASLNGLPSEKVVVIDSNHM
jgi:hypothetical protein